jgi:hypothetical protein
MIAKRRIHAFAVMAAAIGRMLTAECNKSAPVVGLRFGVRAMNISDVALRRAASTNPPGGLTSHATRDISAALTTLLADVFALYIKTKNFHWHISRPHFRDYHLLLDEQGVGQQGHRAPCN